MTKHSFKFVKSPFNMHAKPTPSSEEENSDLHERRLEYFRNYSRNLMQSLIENCRESHANIGQPLRKEYDERRYSHAKRLAAYLSSGEEEGGVDFKILGKEEVDAIRKKVMEDLKFNLDEARKIMNEIGQEPVPPQPNYTNYSEDFLLNAGLINKYPELMTDDLSEVRSTISAVYCNTESGQAYLNWEKLEFTHRSKDSGYKGSKDEYKLQLAEECLKKLEDLNHPSLKQFTRDFRKKIQDLKSQFDSLTKA